MRPCQDCADPEVTGCQCSLDSSDDIAVTGSGSPGDPFVPAAILNPDTGNQLETGASGLLVPTMAYVYAYPDNDQNRTDGAPISFNANDPHTPGTTIHNPVGPTNYDFNITEDGWYEGYAQALVTDTNYLTGLNLYWEDQGGVGTRYSEGYAAETPCIVQTTMQGWFTNGMVLQVRLRFTGVGPAEVQGGNRHRTYAYLAKTKKV